MVNILSIDLEDYFMVSAFEGAVKREDWYRYESRIERNTYRLLDILNGSLRTPNSPLRTAVRDVAVSSPCSSIRIPQSAVRNPVRATFFCLGWIADRFPRLIKDIHKEGHEIASHGYDHRQIYHMIPAEFREDIRKTRKTLEDIIGDRVVGYRAPSYSIIGKTLWALEILAEEGYCYDSSIFPIHHDRYGIPNAPRFPFLISMNGNNTFEFKTLNMILDATPHSAFRPWSGLVDIPHSSDPNSPTPASAEVLTRNLNPQSARGRVLSTIRNPQSILEFPISTVRLFGQNLPISGGGYFRLLPYSIVRKGLKQINDKEKQPFIFYIHPWEIDPDQPRFNGLPITSRIRHYLNLPKTEGRLKKLLHEVSFSSFRGFLADNGFYS